MLMEPSEHLILMDMQVDYAVPEVRLPLEDLKMLADAGIRTAMMFNTVWEKIEPKLGKWDFSYHDERIETLHKAGMKVYLQNITWFPTWLPDGWKAKNVSGGYFDMVSPWNPEAWGHFLEYTTKLRDRYTGRDTVVMMSWLTDGETFMPNEWAFYDDHALADHRAKVGGEPQPGTPATDGWYRDSLLRFALDQQSILVQNPYGEIWTAMHPALANITPNGCNLIDQFLGSWRAAFPDATINHLYCTWIQWGNEWAKMNLWREVFHENVFGGAEYASGVLSTTPSAIAQGNRGALINPCHPFTNYRRVEPWMLDNIRESLKLWA